MAEMVGEFFWSQGVTPHLISTRISPRATYLTTYLRPQSVPICSPGLLLSKSR